MSDYWLARLGRNPISRYFPVLTVAGIGISYYSYHTFLQHVTQKIFGYRNASGEKDTISDDLRALIAEVFLEAREKQKLAREFIETPYNTPPKVIWFAASTLEPIQLGMMELRTGVTIGLPYYYNYKSYDDIPDEALELKKIKLFRNPFKKSFFRKRGKKEDETSELAKAVAGDVPNNEPQYEIIKKFDRNSEHGRAYMDTLVLSDDAKRFSIARELFHADCYRVMAMLGCITGSALLALTFARYSVMIFKQMDLHISSRIPYYSLSIVYGLGMYSMFKDEINKHYAIRARDNARNLGENYSRGSNEYFEKIKLRRELLTATDPRDLDY